MSKAKPPIVSQPSAHSWLADWTRMHGIDWNTTSIPQAAELLIRELEQCERYGQPLPVGLVRLVALLVRIEGEMLLANADAASPFLERACARERTRSLAHQIHFGPLLRPKPTITKPQAASAEEPPRVICCNLVEVFRNLLQQHAPQPKEPRAFPE